MERVPLDQPTLKALAGETRVRILKLLDKKQLTQSDLAAELRMSLPTVAEHLRGLATAELIEREETTRKWKYYSLTQKARLLLHPNTTTIWFVLGLFLFSAAATVFSAIQFFTPLAGFGGVMEARMAAQPEALAVPAMAEAAPVLATTAAASAAPSPLWLVVFGAATLILLILLIAQLKKHGWLGKSLTNK